MAAARSIQSTFSRIQPVGQTRQVLLESTESQAGQPQARDQAEVLMPNLSFPGPTPTVILQEDPLLLLGFLRPTRYTPREYYSYS